MYVFRVLSGFCFGFLLMGCFDCYFGFGYGGCIVSCVCPIQPVWWVLGSTARVPIVGIVMCTCDG